MWFDLIGFLTKVDRLWINDVLTPSQFDIWWFPKFSNTLQRPSGLENRIGRGRWGQLRTRGQEKGVSRRRMESGKGKLSGLRYCLKTSQTLSLHLGPILAGWPWQTHLTPWGFNFPSCKLSSATGPHPLLSTLSQAHLLGDFSTKGMI